MKSRRVQLVVLAVIIGLFGLAAAKQQAIMDWARLRNYTPPAAVAQLATADTMTNEGRHLFYVNHPNITAGSGFSSHCPAGSEKTVVLGCYVGNDNGIYVYQVTDQRLDGVEQVTAAHEMLHAAYSRLSSSERSKVDAMLTDYYEHDLTDQRIKDTIASYKKSEPNDVVNEMHSVFGTEVASLPAPLEQYYKQYFTDRAKVADYTAAYENEFTGRQAQVAAYDVQLKTLKTQIDNDEGALSLQKSSLDIQKKQLDSERTAGQIDAYNAAVPGYNQSVDSYNNLLGSAKNLINRYNSIVETRNQIALEEQQLVQELSSKSLVKR